MTGAADTPRPDGDLLEAAWGVIANAGWDDCAKSPGWQEAAERWRDEYFTAQRAMRTAAQPTPDDTILQATVALVELPGHGQRVAVTITALLGPHGARQIAGAITKTADGMSGAGLIVAKPNGITQAQP